MTQTFYRCGTDAAEVETAGSRFALPEYLARAANNSDRGILHLNGRDSPHPVSYAELLETARCIHGGLRELGCRSGDVALLDIRAPEAFFEALWGCFCAGVVPVPVRTPGDAAVGTTIASRIRSAWDALDRPLLIRDAPSDNEPAAMNPAERAAWRTASVSELRRGSPPGRTEMPLPASAALMLLTSGSTGTPKLVPLSHANIAARSLAEAAVCAIDGADTTLNWLPLDHVVGLVMFHLRDVVLGATQAHGTSAPVLQDPLLWLDWLERYRVTVTWAPNFAFGLANEALDAAPDRRWDLSALRVILNGGETVVRRTASGFMQRLAASGLSETAMHPAWGMSETSSAVAVSTAFRAGRPDDDSPVEVGPPFPGVQFRVLREDGSEAADGETGSLEVRGDTVTDGYYHDPALNAEAFTADGWFRTGDLGILRHGRLTLAGRNKDVVIVNGRNFGCHEIEAAVEVVAGVVPSHAAACAVRLADSDTDSLAVFVSTKGDAADRDRICAEIRARVGALTGAQISVLVLLEPDEFPRTGIGKIARATLRQQWQTGKYVNRTVQIDAAVGDGDEPETDAERMVAAAWQAVLNIPPPGRSAHFFALGGTSLKAARVAARIGEACGRQVPATIAFTHPVLTDMAAALEAEAQPATAIRPRPPGDTAVPCTPPQKRVWFLDRWQPDGAAYVQLLDLRLDGPLDHEALAASLNAIVKRHEALRLLLPATDGEPAQQFATWEFSPLPVTDLRELDPDEREATAKAITYEESRRPFCLETGPLTRWRLLRLGDEEHRLLWTLHHAVTDAASFRLLLQELAANYGALSRGGQPPEVHATQYGDYAIWLDQRLASEPVCRARLELQEWLKEDLEPFELPAQRPRPGIFTYRGAKRTLPLGQDLDHELEAFSRAHGVTPFATALAAFAALLFRTTQRGSITIGTPMSNRVTPECESLVGYVANTVPLRIHAAASQRFNALVRESAESTRFAMERQEAALESLVDGLLLPRDMSRSPIFSVMFQTIDLPEEPIPMGAASLRYVETDNGSAKCDLTLQVARSADGWSATCEFCTDLFDPDFIDRLLGHYCTLLRGGIRQADSEIGSLPLLTGDENRQLEAGWSRDTPELLPPPLLPAVLAEWAHTRGAAEALRFGSSRLSHGELDDRARQFGAVLQQAGVQPGDAVAVCLPRSTDIIAALIGAWKAGAAYVPMEPTLPAARIHEMLEDAAPKAFITADRQIPAQAGYAGAVLTPDDAGSVPAASCRHRECRPDDAAYILFTSGSTGRPKGVAISHRSLAGRIQSCRAPFGFSSEDVFSGIHSVGFDVSGWEIWNALSSGARLVLAPANTAMDGDALWKLIVDAGVSVVQITPSALQLLCGAALAPGAERAPALRMLSVGGEAFPGSLVPAALALGVPVWNVYGPTEATIWASRRRVTADDALTAAVCIGAPLPHVRLVVLDGGMQLMPVGIPGELYIGGEGLAEGYVNQPERTAEQFVENPFPGLGGRRLYRTGDAARMRADGELDFLGRLDDQIKLRGFRIELGEVESALGAFAGIGACAVGVRSDTNGDERLVAWYTAEHELEPGALRQHLLTTLPDYMAPAVFQRVERIPTNSSGKADRKQLPNPEMDPAPAGAAGSEPQTRVERQLARLWENVIGVRTVGALDNFFALGGHSLTAVRLFAQIEKVFGERLPLATLFRYPTVRELATVIESGHPEAGFASLVAIQTEGSLPPFFCVHAAGSEVLWYRDLANRLGADQPFYALQARHVGGKLPPHESVEAMAADYVREIRMIQAEGPYYIGGSSLGGMIAFEMARQLAAAGQTLGIVAMFDAFHPDYPVFRKGFGKLRQKLGNMARVVEHHIGSLRLLPPGRRAAYVRDKTRRARLEAQWAIEGHMKAAARRLRRAAGRPVPPELEAKPHYVRRAAAAYRPSTYAGRITLFNGSRQPTGVVEDPNLGWAGLAEGGIEVHVVPGYHGAIMAEPRVRFLAERLKACLQRNREGARDQQ
ncbi:MAG: amino acid adenylation domain-containing protein [Armatimonadetes bacterium]|nr:amino acid adenylation domain-containing protein [Armatimonadota bacterium]MDE2207053.1 amino acid adenylation domain-containing protein [Armatimonadota bacterium]